MLSTSQAPEVDVDPYDCETLRDPATVARVEGTSLLTALAEIAKEIRPAGPAAPHLNNAVRGPATPPLAIES